MKEPKSPIPVSKLDDPDMQAVPNSELLDVRTRSRISTRPGWWLCEMARSLTIDPDPEMYEDE